MKGQTANKLKIGETKKMSISVTYLFQINHLLLTLNDYCSWIHNRVFHENMFLMKKLAQPALQVLGG